ncbi:Leu/Phe/Val dehydrogenase [Bacillus thermotolerans]|uniref:Phenylalanine dehydrogenase n=1 Tax=Bacillus thermotolerans TaxID=1221996 RepID=DHPH_BACTR|nr:amino acid dehydrogenase [Bacillus thermotolerans]KKB35960.1 Valine dehydrogenase [Bacillus thermotolerans]KKB41149.1 Valine dehydrogenase [Bacillus thermotolerans]KKB43011.1 Valine dehydrogenase [Bacillus thermotolerans]
MNVTKKTSVMEDFTLFEKMSEHEQVVFCNDPDTGLRAIIAIHDTTLGPALGGCRMYPYGSVEEALEDVLRLSKGMSYKCAAADVDFGGGKAVIIGDPQTDKSPELFRAFGQFVESLGGRFYTGTDMGTTMDDFIHAMKETNSIVGVPEAYGGGGDSSVPTAMGVLYGLKATNYMLFGKEDLANASYAIQGLGKVGYKVAEALLEEGAQLFVTDINQQSLQDIQEKAKSTSGSVTVVESTAIYSQEADIFVPCAFGGVINDETIEQLKVKAIAGSANNQLLTEEHGRQLAKKGILYAPDYIINAGGLIQVADELYGVNKERVLAKTARIYDAILETYKQADLDGITTMEAANRMCEQRIRARGKRNHFYTGSVQPKWNIRRSF